LAGRLVAQAAVQPLVVIVAFEVLKEFPARLGLGGKDLIRGKRFGFQRAEERFGRRILIAVGRSAHARLDAQ
jgi:hypothetical protein